MEHSLQFMQEGMNIDDDEEAFLATFRQSLRPDMPVQVDGLTSRPDCNGRAGFLERYHEDKGRWQVRIGAEVLLIKVHNIYP